MPHIREYQALAAEHGIGDVFQDNGGKVLQTLLVLNLAQLPGREGHDARDSDGNEYELKTLNRRLTSSFSTNHHLNQAIIAKYRTAKAWFFSVYDGIELKAIYKVPSSALEPYFSEWESRCRSGDLNNPKIPLSHVRENGEVCYLAPGEHEQLRLAPPSGEFVPRRPRAT